MLIYLFIVSTFLFVGRVGCEGSRTLCLVEGERISLPDSSRYLLCENGNFVVKRCGHGRTFDDSRRECVSTNSVDSRGDQPCSFNGKIPVKGNQNKYIFCELGQIKIGSCPGYFNRFSRECELNYGNQFRVDNDRNNTWLLNDQEKCEEGNKKPVVNSCTKYLECDSTSSWVLAECPDCQHFKPESKQCVWAWKYYCGSITTENPTSTDQPSTEEPTSATTTTEEPTSATTTTKKPKPKAPKKKTKPKRKPVRQSCSNGAMKAFKKGDCKNYYECKSNKWEKTYCSFGYYFDVDNLSCTWSWWATC